MEKVGRFKPGENVSVWAKTAIKAARFIAITAAKTSRGDYPGEHASAGEDHPFGVSQRDSAPTTGELAHPAHSVDRLVETMRGGIPFVEAGEEIAALAEILVGAEGKAVNAAAGAGHASLDKGVQGSNNALTYTAKSAGAAGNAITVELVDPPGNSVALSVDVDGSDIIVTLATDGSSVVTSTASQVKAAIEEDNTASQLIKVANKGTSTGAGVIAAFAKTALAGGTDGADTNPVGKALTAAAAAGDYIEVQPYF